MKGSKAKWLVVFMILYMGTAGMKSCGKDAQEQIGSAKSVLEQAREEQAEQYASDEFRSAEESLLQAREQYDNYRFNKAESSALQAETRARLALEKALEEKTRRKEKEEKEKEKEKEDEELAYNVSSLYSETVLEEPPEEEQAEVALHDIHFEFDSSALSEHAKTILDMNAEWLEKHPDIKIEIEGHCDERGSEEYNLALGAKRARKAYEYLVEYGIDPDRMQTISYGESVPLDPRHNEEAWAKNRRVHFAVIQD
ncbi:MAG: peptidoglycan-associated lipoprotein Pal [bacterium]